MATFTVVSALPKCDFCENKARYDLMTVFGPWANFCEGCRTNNPIHLQVLGTGYGQYLALQGEDVPQHALRA